MITIKRQIHVAVNCLFLFILFFLSCGTTKKVKHKRYKFDFVTSYSQFYLTSDYGKKALEFTANPDDNDHEDRLYIQEKFITIYAGSYGHIRGELFVLDKANPNIEYELYDHVAEGGLDVESGELQILHCPTSAVELKVKVKPGIYRIRVLFSKLYTNQLDEFEGDDRYRIEVWPDDNIEKKVLKRYKLPWMHKNDE